MDIALVTGAASGLGLAIARKLVLSGYRVYGLGGNYSSCPFKHSEFMPITCNMADLDAVQEKINELLEKEQNIHVLVNNAKVYSSKDFDQTSPADLETILKVNLYCPMLLMRLALPGLREYHGYIINIGPTSPDLARGGPAGAAAAGGLHWMSQSLFDQYRETGVKVTTIFPQGNRWRPDEVPAPMTENSQSIIDPEAVADAVEQVVDSKNGNVMTEIIIRPKRITEQPTQSVFYVPYPKPKPLPPVPTRATHAPLDLDIQADRKRYKQQRIEEAALEIYEATEESKEDSNDEQSNDSRNKRRNRRRKERRTELKKHHDDDSKESQDKPLRETPADPNKTEEKSEVSEKQPITPKKSRRNRRTTSKFSEKLDVNKVASNTSADQNVGKTDSKPVSSNNSFNQSPADTSEGDKKPSRNRRRRRRGGLSNARRADDNQSVGNQSEKKEISKKTTTRKVAKKKTTNTASSEDTPQPKRKLATKKTTTKKVTRKVSNKPAESKVETSPREKSDNKVASKKATAKKKTTTKKAAVKKTATKKATTKKVAAKKAVRKTTPKKKTATKKAVTKKA